MSHTEKSLLMKAWYCSKTAAATSSTCHKSQSKGASRCGVLLCPRNGYLQAFEVYTGATDGSSSDGLGATVVKCLTSILKKKGYHLYLDNFFSSVDLAHDLLQDDLYCIAMTCTNRKKWPTSMKDTKAQNKALKRGEHISTVVGGSVECKVCKNNRCVPFINTITQPGLHKTVPRKEKDGQRQDVPVLCLSNCTISTWEELICLIPDESSTAVAVSQGAVGCVYSTSSSMSLSSTRTA